MTKQIILLFVLNFMDAVLTIYWVRNGYAEEGNHLMATLLDMGDIPFLLVKIMVGATTAFVLYYWANFRLARYGLTLALGVYLGLMAIHFFTGLTAAGMVSEPLIEEFASVSRAIFA